MGEGLIAIDMNKELFRDNKQQIKQLQSAADK